ncbi:MAG: hypothetical protein HY340_02355 [Candidatus Kerfeldbacteria bacterium]|nr:hypothetical protein [Candidatus Kerfeldbacteria bacterium]
MRSFVFVLVALTLTLVSPTNAQDQTGTSQTTWGNIKALYHPLGIGAEPVPQPGGIGTDVIRVRPLFVNEHWRDPNNPNSGEHVVMFFVFTDSRNPYAAVRLWQGYQRDWLNRWQMWQRPYGAGLQTAMLFADGTWWWWHRIWNSAPGLASQFELVWY